MIASNTPLRPEIEAALHEVAQTLKDIAKRAAGSSQEASESLVRAAADVTHAAEALRKMAAVTTKNVLHKAAQEVQEHPIASLAAAITAAAALVRVLSSEHQHQQR